MLYFPTSNNRGDFSCSIVQGSRAMQDKWCQSILTLSVRQVATRDAALDLSGSIEVAIMANTSCGPSTRYSSRTGRAYLGHRPDRIDAGRAGSRSVHAFPGRFRLSPRRRLTLFQAPSTGVAICVAIHLPKPLNPGGNLRDRSAASSIGYIQVWIHVRNFGYPRTGRTNSGVGTFRCLHLAHPEQ